MKRHQLHEAVVPVVSVMEECTRKQVQVFQLIATWIHVR